MILCLFVRCLLVGMFVAKIVIILYLIRQSTLWKPCDSFSVRFKFHNNHYALFRLNVVMASFPLSLYLACMNTNLSLLCEYSNWILWSSFSISTSLKIKLLLHCSCKKPQKITQNQQKEIPSKGQTSDSLTHFN